ncbi:sortase [Candidatus Gracilibacteria bacterium]|nr:sortase [Candidatus Gracilibacteria bacterium]
MTEYFKIHISSNEAEQNEVKHEVLQEKTEPEKEKRTLKNIFKDAARQIIASAVILGIGILALNWSAYYKIAKNEVQKFTGTQVESPLNKLTESKGTANVLQANTLNTQSIPALNLEISPSDNRLIIPRINQNLPIVRISSESLIRRDWSALEKEMQNALQDGVVHYPGTSIPGESGNMAITGHSSYFPWDSGRFKDVFALLHDVVVGDKIVMYWDGKKYIYEITEIKVVLPSDISILKQTPENKLTLITCTPVGTNLKRLVVTAKPIEDLGKSSDGKIKR